MAEPRDLDGGPSVSAEEADEEEEAGDGASGGGDW